MAIEKQKWILPSAGDGNAWMVRATKAEEHLKQALDVLNHVRESIPHTPASETKTTIDDFLIRFKK